MQRAHRLLCYENNDTKGKKNILFRCVPSLSLCYYDYWKVSSNKLIISIIIISASFKSSLESQKNEQMNKSLDLI